MQHISERCLLLHLPREARKNSRGCDSLRKEQVVPSHAHLMPREGEQAPPGVRAVRPLHCPGGWPKLSEVLQQVVQ